MIMLEFICIPYSNILPQFAQNAHALINNAVNCNFTLSIKKNVSADTKEPSSNSIKHKMVNIYYFTDIYHSSAFMK